MAVFVIPLLVLLCLSTSQASPSSSSLSSRPHSCPSLLPPSDRHFEWAISSLGVISSAIIIEDSSSSNILIESASRSLYKFSLEGHLAWQYSLPNNNISLVGLLSSQVILFNSSSRSVIFLSILHGPSIPLLSTSMISFQTDQAPTFLCIKDTVILYDSTTVAWVVAPMNHQTTTTASPSAVVQQIRANYEILQVSIDQETIVRVLLKYKKSQLCLSHISSGIGVYLDRCRQMVYNQKFETFAGPHGFLVLFDSKLRVFFFGDSDESHSEEVFKFQEEVKGVIVQQSSEVVVVLFADSMEICRLLPSDLVCPGVRFQKGSDVQITFFKNTQGIIHSNTKNFTTLQHFDVADFSMTSKISVNLLSSNKDNDGDEVKKYYAIPIQVNNKRVVYELLALTKHDSMHFIQVSGRDVKTLSTHNGSLASAISPVFISYKNDYSSPYASNNPPFKWSDINMISAESLLELIISRWRQHLRVTSHYFKGKQVQDLLQDLLEVLHLSRQTSESSSLNQLGIAKMIIIPTRSFALFAIDSVSGELLYKSRIPVNSLNTQSDLRVIGGVSLKSKGDNPADFLIVTADFHSNQVYLEYFDPLAGRFLGKHEVLDLDFTESTAAATMESVIIMKARLQLLKSIRKEHVMIIVESGDVYQLAVFPALSSAEAMEASDILRRSSASGSSFIVKAVKNEIIVYGIGSVLANGEFIHLKKKTTFSLPSTQRLLKLIDGRSSNSFDVSKGSSSLISAGDSQKELYRWLDVEKRMIVVLSIVNNGSSDKKLYLFVIDAESAKVLVEKTASGVSIAHPIDVIFKSNLLVLAFFSEIHKRQSLLIIEIFFQKFLTVFDLMEDPKKMFEKFAANSTVICESKTVFSEIEISSLNVILGDDNNDQFIVITADDEDRQVLIVSLRDIKETEKNILSAEKFRRLFEEKDDQQNNMKSGYKSQLFFDSPLLSSRQTLLEITEGGSIKTVQISPNGRFDELPNDFNFKAVLLSILLVFSAAILAAAWRRFKQWRNRKSDIFFHRRTSEE